MADSIVMSDTIVPALEEIQNMKVADLRKKLKAFGLPTAGNKTELIERLQEACLSSKGDSFDSSQYGFDESQISELDGDDGSAAIEDSALLDQDHLSLYVGSSLEDESKVLDCSESQLSSNSIIMPPKKRSLKVHSENGAVVEKKMTLNRTNVVLTDFDIKIGTESKPETVISNDKSDSEEKKVISVKNMSAAERLAMRAKRFNVRDAAVTTHSSEFASNRNSKQSIISSAVTPDLDVLKKRAERFGQSVSTVMRQIEQKEKLLKRKCKFGANLSISATSSLDEQEKKRRRAERFGIRIS